jgi:GT2 family glycosyltransferase
MQSAKVTAVTVVFGERWKYLTQVVEATMKDKYISTLIIVDNASSNPEEIDNVQKQYHPKIVVLRQKKNIGSSGGFNKGLAFARDTDADFVLLLDDDSVPEGGTVEKFLELRKLFDTDKVVLCGNRFKIPGNEEWFYQKPSEYSKKTFYDILNARKVLHFFKIAAALGTYKKKRGPFMPIVPNESFVFGGAFIPIEGIREAPLPDPSLFLYGDDIEYSWNLKELGYSSYLCYRPKIIDVDFSFGEQGSHIFGLFDPKTADFKVYYRVRNMVRISIRNSSQNPIVLFVNIIIWNIGLCVLGLLKYGLDMSYLKRLKLIFLAVYGGYVQEANLPNSVQPL